MTTPATVAPPGPGSGARALPRSGTAAERRLLADLARLLAVGTGVAATAQAVSAVLAPYAVPLEVITKVLGWMLSPDLGGVVGDGRRRERERASALPRMRAGPLDNWLRTEPYYDAAYLIRASQRLMAGLGSQKISDREHGFAYAHAQAARRRLRSAQANELAARRYGVRLGWYAVMDSITSPECRAANGHNFSPVQATVLGYPGAVHPHCRCKPGPPHARGGWVNEAVAAWRAALARVA